MYYNIHSHIPASHPQEVSLVNLPQQSSVHSLQQSDTPFSVGIHPWDVSLDSLPSQLQLLEKQIQLPNCLALGECGLDKLSKTPFTWQEQAFHQQIQLSESYQKPLIIHCVKAVDRLLQLKKHYQARQAWVFHGFRGKEQQAHSLLQHGFYLSFGLHYHTTALQATPLHRLFLETDTSTHSIQAHYHQVAGHLQLSPQQLQEEIARNVHEVFYSLKK